ncbi:MAG TPA: trypsin-like peptidase domain-containing protein [Candidatus Methylomirabilis sp.]|nr:trypsin-like peptidase domain-containing protein [Candidatus Methylomirabilis sp.]
MKSEGQVAPAGFSLKALWGFSLLVSLWFSIALPGFSFAAGQGEADLEASILRAKPGVVLISSEVGAEVTIQCGAGAARTVTPDPHYETGSGFIIHPDGFIATNGHVVARFYEMNERMLGDEFLEAAVSEACGSSLASLPEDRRKARLRAIVSDPANRRQVRLTKTLQVHLSTGKIYAAQVLAYSPAIDPETPRPVAAGAGGDMGPMDTAGKDIAILKIAERNLPTVRLAPNSTGLRLGEQLFILGYPGVVLNHDFLSRKSALEASVTVGRVSGFKLDITDRRVIQTDASISWGNSGGPAFNLRGEVIGAATFISTTAEGDQAIQGFNFLIPVETVHAYARGISLAPSADSPFTQKWEQAVASYFQGDYPGAARAVEEAERIMPGFSDLMRLRLEAGMRGGRESGIGQGGLRVGLALAGVLALALLATGVRRVIRGRTAQVEDSVPRLAPGEVQRRLDAGSAVALLDARQRASFEESPLQAAGAIRYDIERPSLHALQLQVSPSGEVIAYCDCPDESTSAQVALQLLKAGYRRVAVVRGGFQGLVQAGVAMMPKDVTPTPSAAALAGGAAPPTQSPA